MSCPAEDREMLNRVAQGPALLHPSHRGYSAEEENEKEKSTDTDHRAPRSTAQQRTPSKCSPKHMQSFLQIRAECPVLKHSTYLSPA